MKIKVIIVDDHTMVREGLKSLLEHNPDIKVVAEADNGLTAVALAGELLPDVIVMDISMPGMNGIDAIRQITRDHPALAILALSMHSERHLVIEALEAGARGYLFKECAFDDLARSILTVAGKNSGPGSRLTGIILSDRLAPQFHALHLGLSARELRVLRLIAAGENVKEIATLLKLSVKTIENDRHSIMRQLQIDNIAQLTKYAIREGLASAD
jgi:DNA-binding NarL/FixJ family response regulator